MLFSLVPRVWQGHGVGRAQWLRSDADWDRVLARLGIGVERHVVSQGGAWLGVTGEPEPGGATHARHRW